MDIQKKSLRTGAIVIICAALLRLMSTSDAVSALRASDLSEASSAVLFFGTGRLVRYVAPQKASAPSILFPGESTLPSPAKAVKSADATAIEVKNTGGYAVSVKDALEAPLSWDLTQGGARVLIVHTHGTESYTKTDNYRETSAYRTTDCGYNVVSVGDRLAELLEQGGIEVIHDRTMYDAQSYNGSYLYSRDGVTACLAEHPGICMVLDIHRDAAEDANGNQIGYTAQTPLGSAAKLMLVLGTDSGGYVHPNWRENFALGVKLQSKLYTLCPDICRPISLRSSRFNQDLSTGSLLVEVGTAGNTRAEALVAAEYLAQAILSLAHGA